MDMKMRVDPARGYEYSVRSSMGPREREREITVI